MVSIAITADTMEEARKYAHYIPLASWYRHFIVRVRESGKIYKKMKGNTWLELGRYKPAVNEESKPIKELPIGAKANDALTDEQDAFLDGFRMGAAFGKSLSEEE